MRSSVPTGPPGQRTGGIENWLLRAAEAGDADSQYNLGILCNNCMDDNGYAVAGDRRSAVKWLLAAAEQGLPRAQVKLAEIYADAPDISGSHGPRADGSCWRRWNCTACTCTALNRGMSASPHI